MKSKLIISIFVLFKIKTFCAASQLLPIPLSELNESSDLIVLAKVIDVKCNSSTATVTIKIDSFLKGKLKNKVVSFILIIGGPKGFDPRLEIGNAGVFFLKTIGNEIERAYPGSYAIFNIPYLLKEEKIP